MALDDDLLQRYHDGDLPPEQAREVRARLSQSAADQRRLDQLVRLGEMMRAPVVKAAAELDSDALFARIEADIQKQEKLGLGPRLRLITNEWLEHRRGVLFPAVASMAAAAAALIILFVPRHAEKTDVGAVVTVHGSRVENVDFGQSTGTVFEVENEGVSAAVVWISDEEEP